MSQKEVVQTVLYGIHDQNQLRVFLSCCSGKRWSFMTTSVSSFDQC